MYKAIESTNIFETIKFCYTNDPSIVKFSRNSECCLEDRILKEVECYKQTDSSFKFFRIVNENNDLVGYFGIEHLNLPCLTTFFILPDFRQDKNNIWEFIISHMPNEFYSAVFKVNTRAIRFFQKNNGMLVSEGIAENKPMVLFKFMRGI